MLKVKLRPADHWLFLIMAGSNDDAQVICTELRKPSHAAKKFEPKDKRLSVCCFAFRDDFEHRNFLPQISDVGCMSFPLLPQKDLSPEDMANLCKFFWLQYGSFAGKLAVGDEQCALLEENLHKDLRQVGSDVPSGYPNSRVEGLHRGNGLFAGEFAAAIHALPAVRGFAGMAFNLTREAHEVAPITDVAREIILMLGPFLYTTTEHHGYKSNKESHTDTTGADAYNIKVLAVLAGAKLPAQRRSLTSQQRSLTSQERVLRARVIMIPRPNSEAPWCEVVRKLASKHIGAPPMPTRGSGSGKDDKQKKVIGGGVVARRKEVDSLTPQHGADSCVRKAA